MTTPWKRALAATATVIAISSAVVTLSQTPQLTWLGVSIGVGVSAAILLVSAAVFQLVALVDRIKANQELIERLQSKLSDVNTRLRPGEYIFIDGQKEAFDALIAATLRAKHHVRSTRFSPPSIKATQAAYAEAIRMRVMGEGGYERVQHYSRIIAANNKEKLDDIKAYVREFWGKPFTFYLTTQKHNFELVVIDDTEVFIHFYSQGFVIKSTLHIPSKDVAERFMEIYDRLHKRRVYPDIRKYDCSQILEPDIEKKLTEIERYFDLAISGISNPSEVIDASG